MPTNVALVARTLADLTHTNTLVVVTDGVRLRFQIAPGAGPGLGIPDIQVRILSGGQEIATRTTNSDGEVVIPLQALLSGPVTVEALDTEYDLTLHPGLANIDTKAGQQKRLDVLGYIAGYQLSHARLPVPDDGTDGTRTQQAIMNFQADQTDATFAIDGDIGPQTKATLRRDAGA